MKHIAPLALLGLIAACAPMPSTATYKFHDLGLGLGEYSYHGEVNAQAVRAYVADTKAAVNEVSSSPAVSTVVFHVGTGRLVIENAKAKAPTNSDLEHFKAAFLNRHVMLRRIILKSYGGRQVRWSTDVFRSYGGGARYLALHKIEVSDPSAVQVTPKRLDAIKAALSED